MLYITAPATTFCKFPLPDVDTFGGNINLAVDTPALEKSTELPILSWPTLSTLKIAIQLPADISAIAGDGPASLISAGVDCLIPISPVDLTNTRLGLPETWTGFISTTSLLARTLVAVPPPIANKSVCKVSEKVPIPPIVILLNVDIPVDALTFPSRLPVTFPVRVLMTAVALTKLSTFTLFPTVTVPVIVAPPTTWSSSEGFVIPIPSEPPIPVSVINLALLAPRCQIKSPSTAAGLLALKW